MKSGMIRGALFILAVLSTFHPYAQGFIRKSGAFEVQTGLGLVLPQRSGGRGGIGIGIVIEPCLFIHPNLSLGLRMASATISRNIRESGEGFTSDVVDVSGVSGTLEAHFSHISHNPYMGLGLGFQSIELRDPAPSVIAHYANSETVFSTLLRAGLVHRKWKMGLEYHVLGKTAFISRNNHLDMNLCYRFTFNRKKR